MASIVNNRTAEQLLHQSLNANIQAHKDIFPQYKKYIDKDVAVIQKPQLLALSNVDAAITPFITQYLAQIDKKDSSSLAQMSGGQLFQILRIFRDLDYTSQNRQSRLLNGFRGHLIKAKTNIAIGRAFI